MRTPFEPPIATTALPAPGGRMGPQPEDFVVDEVPLYAPSGEGPHWYVLLRKRGWTTPAALRAVASAAGVGDRELGSAGMKDKHALTSQWLSVPASAPTPPGDWRLPDGLEVLAVTRHRNKLRTGHCRGNRFCIRLVDVGEDALRRAEAIAAQLVAAGLANYFGAQRFGRGGGNLERALGWLESGASARRVTHFERKLLPSVVQSEVFNRYLAERSGLGLEKLLAGEVVRLEGSRSCFTVTRPEQEQARLERGELHLTGPMIGPKLKAAEADTLRLEEQVTAAAGLNPLALEHLGRCVDGTRRDLLVPLPDLQVHAPDAGSLELRFTLPSGSYATQLVRELTREPFLGDSRLLLDPA